MGLLRRQGTGNLEGQGTRKKRPDDRKGGRLRPGMADAIAGETKDFVSNLYPYLPQDLIGGSIPHIPGTEDEAVWNAASQACGTEKVHFVYTAESNRIWYLACPSAALASSPDSWCPLAAALPGNSEFWDRETVYIYEQEGQASALRWDPETGRMQVFLGAARTILPRVQSMDANFVTINPSVADIIPWRNRMLKTEKLSRAVVRLLVISGLIVNLAAALILFLSLISMNFINNDLENVKKNTDQAALDLMHNASNVMQSDAIKHMVRTQELLDELSPVNGFLVKYEVSENSLNWEALVPEVFAAQIRKTTKAADEVTAEPGGYVRIKGKR